MQYPVMRGEQCVCTTLFFFLTNLLLVMFRDSRRCVMGGTGGRRKKVMCPCGGATCNYAQAGTKLDPRTVKKHMRNAHLRAPAQPLARGSVSFTLIYHL